MFTTAMVTGRIALVSSYKGYVIQLHVPKKVTLQTLLLP